MKHRVKLTNSLISAIAGFAICFQSCSPAVSDHQEHFIGTNFWYGPILASDGPGSDHERLCAELDSLKSLGITNLRVLAGADGEDGAAVKVRPALQTAPGVYNEDLLNGIGRFLSELEKRDMKAVIYLNNAWEWSGGYGTYLEWAGAGKCPDTRTDGYVKYMDFVSQFPVNEKAKELYWNHLRFIVERFKDSKAIYSWQIANEPRCFSSKKENQDAFVDFIWRSAALIKSIDGRHPVSAGTEGRMGSELDIRLFERLAQCPDIDYLNIHIWPLNWGWIHRDSVEEDLPNAIRETDKYIDEHAALARRLHKKIAIEEFGYPRDGFVFSKGSPTSARDAYYSHIFERIIESAEKGGELLGCNFWGWGGLAEQTQGHIWWEEGDDYCADPSQEEQGLNSVYLADRSTIETIRKAATKLAKTVCVEFPEPEDWIMSGTPAPGVKVDFFCAENCKLKAEAAFVSDTTLMSGGDTILYICKELELKAGKSRRVEFEAPKEPGFYEFRLSVEDADGTMRHRREFNIGIDAEKIVSPLSAKEDFNAFWEQSLKELAKVPMDVSMTLVPEYSTASRNVYEVEFKSLGGATMGGIYAEPVQPGKYPAIIEYMGYGAEPFHYWGDENPQTVQLLVSVRNQGIFKDEGRWILRGLDSKENFYYRGAYCDAVRAIDFICSREKVDSERIVSKGESQGGALCWISAALDHRVKAIAPSVPFMSDFEDYGDIVYWPVHEVLQEADRLGMDHGHIFGLLSYFDIKNFTSRVECPVLMAFGLQDPTCPPHTNFAGYNMVRSEKQWYCAPLCGHGMWQESEWAEIRDAFLHKYLNT